MRTLESLKTKLVVSKYYFTPLLLSRIPNDLYTLRTNARMLTTTVSQYEQHHSVNEFVQENVCRLQFPLPVRQSARFLTKSDKGTHYEEILSV
jgi:hypothetical protein